MQQILFTIPFTQGLFGRFPDGIPVYGFGAMLFLTFVLVAMVWGPRRAARVGVPRDRLQDMAIVMFLAGIAGARVVYMVQYAEQFPDKSVLGLVGSFFQIWNGGIVLYGGLIGGFLGYYVFHRVILKRLGVNWWKLADAIAPLLAFGIAVGRLGCYLNGCCWGQPVCPECQPVPLSAALGQFPLLPAHAREQVCQVPGERDRLPAIHGLQTATGFTLGRREPYGVGDPRSVIDTVEPGSAAAAAGLRHGDRVVEVNGRPNKSVVELTGPPDTDAVEKAAKALKPDFAADGVTTLNTPEKNQYRLARVEFDTPAAYRDAALGAVVLPRGVRSAAHDTLWELVRDWPRGRNDLALVVERDGARVPVTFTPRTVPFYPTQLYETVSMLLLVTLLLAFQPFRRHDGQVMVVCMLGYAVHRFFNEAIRIEPTYTLGLTLSQWISLGIFAIGVALEVYLRWAVPKLPAGPLPLDYGTAPAAPAPA